VRYLPLTGFLILAGLTASAPAADAAVITINFEEFAPDNGNGGMPANRYAGLGATFAATDDGTTWAGLGGGDPGNWGLAGTNGSTFAGFNGDSYGLSMFFAPGITAFSLDASRSNGSGAGDSVTVQAWAGATLLQSQTIALGAINTWSAFSLGGPNAANEIRIFGSGQGFHPFGIDNIRFTTVPEPTTMLLLGAGIAALGARRYRRNT